MGRLVRDSKYKGKFIISVTSRKSFCTFIAVSLKLLAAFFFFIENNKLIENLSEMQKT